MDKDNTWRIRNVNSDTRKRIRFYAVQHGISVGQALSILTSPAGNAGQPDYGVVKTGDFVVTGDLRAAYEELKKRYE